MPAASSMEQFTTGWALRASTAARAKNGRNESLVPSRPSKSALASWRSRAILVTSASRNVVSCALVWSDSVRRWAMTLRSRDMFSVRPRTWVAEEADTGWSTNAGAGADVA